MIWLTVTSNNSGNYTCVGSTAQATVTATYYLSVTDNMDNGKELGIKFARALIKQACNIDVLPCGMLIRWLA